jgi:NAD kinase
VLPHDQSVHIEVMTKDNKFSDVRVSLTLDGQTYVTLKRGDVVSAALDGTTVKFLRRKEDTFYETLRNKLKWGEGL